MPDKFSSELSIVVQGPIMKNDGVHMFSTLDIIEKLKNLFPSSEIILSTWMYEDTNGIEGCEIIKNIDPGAMLFEEGSKKTNNLNRMLVSTQEGIRRASRRYLLKIRSDMMPSSDDFVRVWKTLSRSPKKFAIFSKQVLAYPIYSLRFERDAGTVMPKPFHLSDWAFFGLRADIDFLFSISLAAEPKFSTYFLNEENKNFDTIPEIKWQYSPEQYLFYKAFSKKYHVKFDNKRDYNPQNSHQSRISMLENFLFLDPDMWGLVHGKPFYNRPVHEYDPRCYSGLYRFFDSVMYNLLDLRVSYFKFVLPEYLKRRKERHDHKVHHNL